MHSAAVRKVSYALPIISAVMGVSDTLRMTPIGSRLSANISYVSVAQK